MKEQKKSKKQKSKSHKTSKKASKSKKSKKKSSSFKLGRNQNDNLNEDDVVSQDPYEDIANAMDYEDIAQSSVQRKLDEVKKIVEEENIDIEQDTADQGDNIQSTADQNDNIQRTADQGTDPQSTGVQSTLDQGDQGTAALNVDEVGPSTSIFDEEAGPSNPIQQEEIKKHTTSDDETIAQIMLNLTRPRGISISEPAQVSESSSESEELDPKDKGKGIMKVTKKKKKKKITLAQLREFEVAKNEEIARQQQAIYDVEYLRESRKPVAETRRPMTKAQERNWMISFLKGRGFKNLQRLRYPEVKELWDSVQESIKRELDSFVPMDSEKEKKLEEIRKEQVTKRKLKRKRATQDDQLSKRLKMLRPETIDELRNYLRVVDFENTKKIEDAEKKSKISSFSVVESSEGDYLIFHREDESFTIFNMLWDILHKIDREDLYDLYLQVQTYFEDTEPIGVGLILLGELMTIWETNETSS